MDTIKSHLEVLSEDAQGKVNYDSWRFKLNLILKTKNLFEVTTGLEVKPEGEADDEQVKVWLKKDLEAQALIGLNVSSNIARKISTCVDAKSMLDKLINLYGKRSDITIAGLQRKFFSYVYDSGMSAVENCMEIMQISDLLSAAGEPTRPGWIMTRILGMLPPKLHHFRTAWDNVSEADKTLDNMMERLRLEEDRLSESDQTSGTSTSNVLITRNGNNHGRHNTPKQKQSEVSCFKCGKKGHVKKYCHNKPCAKYIDYCKEHYTCNTCGAKGHFAKDCNRRPDDRRENDGGGRSNSRQTSRRALITIGLSTASLNDLNARQDVRNHWYQDCAATQHMTSNRHWFSNFVELEVSQDITIGDFTRLKAIGKGDVELEAYNGKRWYQVVLRDVLYVPKLSFNLFSVSQTLDRNYVQSADKDKSIFMTPDRKEIVAMAEREGNLFKMMLRREATSKCLITESIKTWHERMAHQNVKHVREILDRKHIKYIDDWHNHVCEGCTYGKQHRVSHPRNEKIARQQLDLVHVDMCEMNVTSLGRAKYFLLFKDDYSHYRTVYFLKTKEEAPSKLEIFMKTVENHFGRQVKCLRSDNGKEIKNTRTRKILEDLGIFHSFSVAYTPEQNGRIEREMRTVVEAARSAIHARNLDMKLWAEAVNYSVFTLNQTGTSTRKGLSPAEMWFGRQVDPRRLHTFGIHCYVLIPNHKRAKLDRKSKKGILVGYDWDSPSYRVYLENDRDVISSENVIFSEEEGRPLHSKLESDIREEISTRSKLEAEVQEDENRKNQQDEPDQDMQSPRNLDRQEDFSPRRSGLRNRRDIQPPARYSDYVMGTSRKGNSANTAILNEIEDISVSAALKDEKWRQAMSAEIESLRSMNTWKLMQCPDKVRPLTCRWVLKEKADGKLKARLVARGFEQEQGLDYTATFSPVARHVSIRLILSYAASKNLKLLPFDVTSAFLYGDLEEDIYMEQPEGFEDGTNQVCKLQKSLYGLKQAPRKWNEKIASFLETIGLWNTDDDPCVYYNDNRSILMTLFVDDGLVVGRDEKEMYNILEQIHKRFKITYNHNVHDEFSYIGMNIQVRSVGIFINQANYIRKVLKRFGSDLSNPANTPVEKGMLTSEENKINDRPVTAGTPYREVIGSLMYLATISRPDISYVVNYLSRFCSKPMMSHWKMAKRTLQYLKGTSAMGILFDGDEELKAYSDSDFAGDAESGHSTSGILIMRGGPVVWITQKQRLVATSTAEAEYRAAVSAIDDISWVKRIGLELGIIELDQPISLFVDNQSAIHMLHSAHEGKTIKGKKHIEIPRKFIQEHIGRTVSIHHVASSDQLADILTKPLNRKIFLNLRCQIVKEEC